MATSPLLEQAFDNLFQQLGFERVDSIVGKSPTFQNADYFNQKYELVVELKIIEKDFFKEGGIIDSLNGFVPAGHPLIKDGTMLPGLYSVTIPPLNREGKHDNFQEPLRRSIKKAKDQLKETRQHLFNGKGYGFVIIALNMPMLIDIYSAEKLVNKLMNEFSSVTGYLVCIPAMAKIGAGVSCIHGIRMDAPTLIEQIISEMGDRLCAFFHEGNKREE